MTTYLEATGLVDRVCTFFYFPLTHLQLELRFFFGGGGDYLEFVQGGDSGSKGVYHQFLG